MPTKSYDDLLFEELRDPELAAGYLSESLRGGSLDVFLIALRNVAQARRMSASCVRLVPAQSRTI